VKINRNNKKAINEYTEKMKKNGFKLTTTRKVILETLLENPGKLSAEELFFLSHNKYPKIGQATVYRNLKLLEKEGLLVKKGYEGNKAKYMIKNDLNLISKNDKDNIGSYKTKRRQNEISEKTDIKNNKRVFNVNPPDISYKSTLKDYIDIGRISAIQNQLGEWLDNLKKMKREKEWALEDVIKDFGKVDKIIGFYNNRRSDLIQMLLDIQNEYRWLPKHILLYISNKLDIPLSEIYDVTTFYKYFNLEPQGKHSIVVCMGTACHVRGAMNLLQRIVNVLGVKPGDTTDDYNFTLSTVNCLGCCALGPVMMIDNKYYSNPSVAKIRKKKLKNQKKK